MIPSTPGGCTAKKQGNRSVAKKGIYLRVTVMPTSIIARLICGAKKHPAAAGWGLILLSLAAMVHWSWLTWPDPMIDFGREAYVPWKLSEGAVLYRDIAYHNGPLSPYLNALFFRLFHPSLHLLFSINGILLLIMLALVYTWALKISGRIGALASALVFILLFAFERFLPYGNYNWMAPYSHEMTHGLLLATASLLCLVSNNTKKSLRFLAAGAIAGLVFLTKSEIFIALACAITTVFILRFERRGLLLFMCGFLVPVLSSFLLFLTFLPVAESAAATSGAWRYVIAGGLKSVFAQTYAGTDSLGASLALLSSSVLGVAAMLVLLAAVSWKLFSHAERTGAFTISFLVTAGFLLLAGKTVQVDYAFLGLPAWCVMLIAFSAFRLKKSDRDDERIRWRAALVFAVFSLVLLLKVLLSTQIIHYGFVLALPATILCVCALLDWLPELLSRHRTGAEQIFRAGAGGLLVGTIAWFLQVMHTNLAPQTHSVGWNGDVFRADLRGASLQQAAETMRARFAPSDTLVVVPESEMLNYLLRAKNPTPYGNFNPHQLEIFGENRVVVALAESPPTHVIWVDRIYDEYDADYLGKDYGRQLVRWLMENYDAIESLAPGSRLMESRMPILLFKRKPSTVGAAP